MEAEGVAPGGGGAEARGGAPQVQEGISRAPVNVLFNMSSIAKKDVWEIDLIKILELLMSILERSGKKDLRVAGMAALSSSLIYRMKVDRIFALHREAMEKKPVVGRRDVDIAVLDIPYRHEPTRPVSLDELLAILEGLISTIANPKRRRGRLVVEPEAEPDFEGNLIALENVIGTYETLVLSKLGAAGGSGSGLLGEMTAGLDDLEAVRCFLAVLFLARDERVDLAQEGDDIRVTLIAGAAAEAGSGGTGRAGGAAAEAEAEMAAVGTESASTAAAPEAQAAAGAAAAAAAAAQEAGITQ